MKKRHAFLHSDLGEMMMRTALIAFCLVLGAWGCAAVSKPPPSPAPTPAPKPGTAGLEFHPVSHASFAIAAPEATIHVDPVGEPEAWAGSKPADLILITHAHGDHLAPKLLAGLRREGTLVLGPKVVVDELKYGEAMANGDRRTVKGVTVEAVPAYNATKERLQFHPKGRDNGYVVTAGGKRVYVSGDTEDVPEMRALKDIDYAFVCMNLPYTMTVEQAASAVLEFRPKVVIPYHYRGKEGPGELEAFRKAMAADPAIEVRLLKWYEPPPKP